MVTLLDNPGLYHCTCPRNFWVTTVCLKTMAICGAFCKQSIFWTFHGITGVFFEFHVNIMVFIKCAIAHSIYIIPSKLNDSITVLNLYQSSTLLLCFGYLPWSFVFELVVFFEVCKLWVPCTYKKVLWQYLIGYTWTQEHHSLCPKTLYYFFCEGFLLTFFPWFN